MTANQREVTQRCSTDRRFSRRRNAFTLIELLVVISIISLLASIVLASLNSARDKARVARTAATVRQYETALELYFDDNGDYPGTDTTEVCLGDVAPGTSCVGLVNPDEAGIRSHIPGYPVVSDFAVTTSGTNFTGAIYARCAEVDSCHYTIDWFVPATLECVGSNIAISPWPSASNHIVNRCRFTKL